MSTQLKAFDEIVMIPVADLDASETDIVRVESINDAHVEELAEALAHVSPPDWPPLLVRPWDVGAPDDGYAVLGGVHRVIAATHLGIEALPCRIVPHGDWEAAFEDNRLHGLGPSRADRKLHARRLAHRYPELSYREIGRRSGLSDKTVKAALTEGEGSIPSKQSPKASPIERWLRATYRLGNPPTIRDIRTDIDAFDEEDRPDVADIYAVIGHVLIEGASPYLE